MELFDTHAHLDFQQFNEDRDKVINRAYEKGVKYIVNIGADIQSSRRSLDLACNYENIYASVGIHPHDADKLNDEALDVLKEMAFNKKVLAIGEIGLDYHYDNSPRLVQKKAFKKQLKLAEQLNLPVVIHSREAEKDTLEILKDSNVKKTGGIMHCFSGDALTAKKYLDLNFYLAFGGVATFRNAGSVRDVVKEVPLNRILIETDSPYLTPAPYRGQRNEPAYIKYVAEIIAKIKKIKLEKVADITTSNALKIYNI